MGNEIKLNLDLFRSSPHLCRRHGPRQMRAQTHTPALARAPAYVPPEPPLPCQRPSWEIRRLETGQPWPMYIFMGLIWHHFSLLPEKEMYLIYTIPIWPVGRGERRIGKAGLKSGFHPFSRIYVVGSVCRCVGACARAARVCLCKGENRNISSYSRPVQ